MCEKEARHEAMQIHLSSGSRGNAYVYVRFLKSWLGVHDRPFRVYHHMFRTRLDGDCRLPIGKRKHKKEGKKPRTSPEHSMQRYRALCAAANAFHCLLEAGCYRVCGRHMFCFPRKQIVCAGWRLGTSLCRFIVASRGIVYVYAPFLNTWFGVHARPFCTYHHTL